MTKVKKPMPNMSRAHVRGMMCPKQGQGYAAARRVLEVRKALPEHFNLLEELRKQQLAAERLEATISDEEMVDGRCRPGCGVCSILIRTSQKKIVHSILLAKWFVSRLRYEGECYGFLADAAHLGGALRGGVFPLRGLCGSREPCGSSGGNSSHRGGLVVGVAPKHPWVVVRQPSRASEVRKQLILATETKNSLCVTTHGLCFLETKLRWKHVSAM